MALQPTDAAEVNQVHARLLSWRDRGCLGKAGVLALTELDTASYLLLGLDLKNGEPASIRNALPGRGLWQLSQLAHHRCSGLSGVVPGLECQPPPPQTDPVNLSLA